MVRIVIVEDNDLLRNNLQILLEGEKGVSVVGTYPDAEDALENIDDIPFDILLADIGLPGRSGIELIGEVKSRYPDVDILAHTVFDNRGTVYSAIKAGASGYMLKGSSPRELIEALHSLHHGGAPMSPKIARAIITDMQDGSEKEHYILSPRETQILKGLEDGFTYAELAEQFNISSHTVHSHIKNIYEKLHARGRQDALVKARKKGII
ncbi:MAG: response regulator transcription factor [Spirochaetales bacterium]|nr:response regulator transcription factor [Spirochaetales bacterium]